MLNQLVSDDVPESQHVSVVMTCAGRDDDDYHNLR